MSFIQQIKGVHSWFTSFLDPTNPKTSVSLFGMITSIASLTWGFVRLIISLSHAIEKGSHATTADVSLLAVTAVPLASIAGVAYWVRPDGAFSTNEVQTPRAAPTQPPSNPQS